MLEHERPLGTGAGERREPLGQRGRAVRVDEDGDTIELVVSHVRIPVADGGIEIRARRSRRVVERHELEQAVHCIADLGRGQARASPPVAPTGSRREAENALGVEAVRAALEERERAVREAPNVVDRRLRNLGERRELDPEARPARRELVEEREL